MQGSSGSFKESVGSGTFWGFWVLLGVLFAWEVLALLVYPSCSQSLRYAGVPIAGHAHWVEVGGRIFFVAFWEFTGFPLNALRIFRKVMME